MDQPSQGLQWAVHAADRKGWEVRLTSYERLLRSVMEMLEATHSVMKAEDLVEELRYVGRAMIELEEAWAALALKKTAALARADEQSLRQPEREKAVMGRRPESNARLSTLIPLSAFRARSASVATGQHKDGAALRPAE
jgi:hypothetical protein